MTPCKISIGIHDLRLFEVTKIDGDAVTIVFSEESGIHPRTVKMYLGESFHIERLGLNAPVTSVHTKKTSIADELRALAARLSP